MKKFLVVMISVMAVLGAFTSCGNDESESSISEISESSIAESSETETEPETEPEITTTEAIKTTVTEKATTVAKTTVVTTKAAEQSTKEDIDISAPENHDSETEIENADEYIAALENIFNVVLDSNTDMEKILKSAVPKSTFTAMKNVGMVEYMDFGDTQDIINAFSGISIDDLGSIKVVSVEPADPDYIKASAMMYSRFEGICSCLIDAGLDYSILMSDEIPENKTQDEIMELVNKLSVYIDETQDIDITVDFVSYDMVTYKLMGQKIEYPVFKTNDDIAKIDVMMLGHSMNDD